MDFEAGWQLARTLGEVAGENIAMKVINLILCGINGDMEMLWKVKNRIVYII
jgi:hypothetical protein